MMATRQNDTVKVLFVAASAAVAAIGVTFAAPTPMAHASEGSYLADVQQIPAFTQVSADEIVVYGHLVCYALAFGEPSQTAAVAKAVTKENPQVTAQEAAKLVAAAERDLC
jgi:hypothetical protein